MNSRMMEVGGMAAISAGLRAVTGSMNLSRAWAFACAGDASVTPYRRGSAYYFSSGRSYSVEELNTTWAFSS